MGQIEHPAEVAAGRLFRVWVRRALDASSVFGLRFEVGDGKGTLRVTRPGVLIDPPARQAGSETALTGAQVRASRFIHARDAGRGRVAYGFSRLDDASLERLPLDRWVELHEVSGGAGPQLEIPGHLPLVDLDSPVDEATSPQRMLEELRDELSSPGPTPDEHTPVAPTSRDEAPVDAQELADWAAFDIRERPAPASTPVVAEVEVTGTVDGEALVAEADEDEEDDVELDESPPPTDSAEVPRPPVEADFAAFHQRNTTLVRFLRRRLVAEEQRVRLLEAQMRVIQARSGG